MLLSLAEIRELFETDLGDVALQTLLDAAEEEIVTHAGAHVSASDFFRDPRARILFLQRKAASITSITERVGDTETVLDATDYRVVTPRELMRSLEGPNPRFFWGDEVTVDTVPVDDTDTRKRVQADLVKLSAQYQGLSEESGGDFKQRFPEYELERAKILSRLTPHGLIA
jgi:hypothetical protein